METDETIPLAQIRDRIDRLDADIHRLLIERSSVIDELIRIKGTSAPGAAFRPDREAEMMRRIVMRHKGRLPLSTVEHIWREIITAFTAMQAPFSVVSGPSDDPGRHRDIIRFYFGFSIDVEEADSEEDALALIAQSDSKIAALALRDRSPWWQALEPQAGMKIFAKFPFLKKKGIAGLPPVYIAGSPVKDFSKPDICLFSLRAGSVTSDDAIGKAGAAQVIRCGNDYLLEVPGDITDSELSRALEDAGVEALKLTRVGGFARPVELL